MTYQNLLDLLDNYPFYLRLLALVGLAMAIGFFLTRILFGILKATNRQFDSFTITAINKRLRGPVFWFAVAGLTTIFWSGMPRTEATPFYLDILVRVARTVLYIFGALGLVRATDVIADTIKHRFAADEDNDFTERKILTQLQYIQRIAVIVIGIVAMAFILLQFDGVRSLGAGILTSAGVTGIIVGLAAQKSIANLLAGFQIAFTQPIRLDDSLVVNGEYGQVEDITLTYVVLKIWDERRLIVPLQHFIDQSFQNWTHTSSNLLGSVYLYVDYGFPVAALREEVERFLNTQELWDRKAWSVVVTDVTKDAMQIRVLVSAVDAGSTFNLRCIVREHLMAFVQEHYPQHWPRTRMTGPGLPAN